MDGVKEQGQKLLADLRGAVNKLVDADTRLTRSAFALADATRTVQRMPESRDKAFALERLATIREKLAPHTGRVAALKKTAGALLNSLRALLKPFGVGVVQIVLPIVAIAALLIAVTKLYNAIVNDTKQANIEAEKLKLLAEGKITADELAAALDKKGSGGGLDIFGDVKKLVAVAAVLILAPTIISAMSSRRQV